MYSGFEAEIRKDMVFLKLYLKDIMDTIKNFQAKQDNITMAEVSRHREIEREFHLPCKTVPQLLDLDSRAADISA